MKYEVLSNIKIGQNGGTLVPGDTVEVDERRVAKEGLVKDGILKPLDEKAPEKAPEQPAEETPKQDYSKLKVGELKELAIGKGLTEKEAKKLKKPELVKFLQE